MEMKRKSILMRNHETMMHPSESSPRNRGCQYYDRCGNEHRAPGLNGSVDDPIERGEAPGGSKMLSGVSLFGKLL